MSLEQVIRILLADDHAMFRTGIRSVLEKQANLKVVAEAEDGRQAIELALALRPEVMLMDITMPSLNGIEATRQIRQSGCETRIIGLSMHSDRQFVTEMLKAGAAGYLLKNSAAAELDVAIESVMEDEVYLSPKVTAALVDHRLKTKTGGPELSLTPREREVLQLLAEGKTNKEVANDLGISTKTVETHRAQIMDKLGIRTVAGLTKYAIRHGLTSLDA